MLLLPSAIAMAQQTEAETKCMQERAGFSLNCTANDVGVAGVAKDSDGNYLLDITDPCSGVGDTVTFTATFEVLLTAQERHDIGIYFATDGDTDGDGALTSDDANAQKGCSVSKLLYTPDPPWVDLDGTGDPYPGQKKASGVQDTCGDIDAAHNPLYPEITVTAICRDQDDDGFLDLPNCVSWRQSGANELCTSPTEAFPGSPSKCKCDTGFNVPVPVPANATVVKKVRKPAVGGGQSGPWLDELELSEPGGPAEYRVQFTVDGTDRTPDVTVQTLIDSLYGDITSVHGDITFTTCQSGSIVDGNGGVYECFFTADASGNAGDQFPDTVTVTATDNVGNVFDPTDSANVKLLDVLPAVGVTKTANPTELQEPGGLVTFTVTVTSPLSNVSSDPLTINSLTDDKHGNLNGKGNCAVPQTLSPGASYQCSFTVDFTGKQAGFSEMDTVTVWAADDEENTVSANASAMVEVKDVLSEIKLTKTANPTIVDEGGEDVTFTVTIDNLSAIDTVTINSLVDTVFGDLDGVGTCDVPVTIAKSGWYSCTFTVKVTGNALDPAHTNVVTASGVDDDGKPVSASDPADVDFRNVPPAASLTKTVTGLVVTYAVQVFNESDAEALTLNQLSDDAFGDVTQVQGDVLETSCSVPQLIEIGGSYSCSFKAAVSSSPHTNTLTGTVDDDDGSASIYPADSAIVSFGKPPQPE